MTDLIATALGLIFTVVVCLLAVRALVGPWLRMHRRPERSAAQPDEKRTAHPGGTPLPLS